ncbi:universal stress protein [Phocicoccus pinnipedialis]|uniref:Universal stress protein/MT1672 n=1 Tax=Phocicoccus pinnipedialis TaxID=110845 RepID=A0A6V7R5W2_9BACL|nr:universal stress protein [Jeotgalicoccus pinnipedialis]MBP1939780.1 nucleotide-binding universal stress UspA family protein [Jeotgalicoccus pinnipedialis]CAD2072408.1 Universal stress protein/MT1672 [Jeotgalicoccus pinnipedialis]
MYKSIFIATDASKNALRAVKEVIHLNCTDIHVTLVYVKDARATRDSILHDEESISHKEKVLNALQESIDFLEDNDIRYEVKLLHGEVHEVLIEKMNNGNYDVAIIGRTGKSILKDLMIGSVSKKMIKAANIPVLVVN